MSEPKTPFSPSDRFWSGYAGETTQGLNHLRQVADEMPYGHKSYRNDLPTTVDPRLDAKFAEGWMRTEMQGGVGACFFADQMLTLADGTRKPIQDMSMHDMVMSHAGDAQPVNELFQRQYTGGKYTIKVNNHAEPIVVTGNHPFMRQTATGEFDKIRADELSVGDEVYLSSAASAYSRHTLDLADYLPEDCPVGVDWVRGGIRSKKLPRYVDLDERLGWLLGFYAAEGYVITPKRKGRSHGRDLRVQFAFHKKEKHNQQKCARLMRELFGIEMGVIDEKDRPNNYYLYTGSRTLGLVLQNLMGKGAGNKRVPAEILAASDECKDAFLRGWMAGDGSIQFTLKDGEQLRGVIRAHGYSISLEMGRALETLSLSLGYDVTSRLQPAREGNRKPQYVLGFRGRDVVRLCEEEVPDWVDDYLTARESTDNRCANRGLQTLTARRQKVLPSMVTAQIESITVEQVTDVTVYNLEANTHHTVVVNGMPVFQCQGYGLVSTVEYLYAVITGEVVQLSPMYAYLMSQFYDGISGDRGSTLSGGTKVLEKTGVPLLEAYSVERTYPRGGYRAVPQSAIDAAKATPFQTNKVVRFKDADHYRAFVGSMAGIAQTGTRWTSGLARVGKHGVVQSIGGSSFGGHSWNFIGYMPIDEMPSDYRSFVPRTSSEFINLMFNSHGTGWGHKGVGYMIDEFFNQLNKSDLILGRTDMSHVTPRPSKRDFTKWDQSRFTSAG